LARFLANTRKLKKVLNAVSKILRLARGLWRAVGTQLGNTKSEMRAVDFAQFLQINFLRETRFGSDRNNFHWKRGAVPPWEELFAAGAGCLEIFAACAGKEGVLRKASGGSIASTNHRILRASFSRNLRTASKKRRRKSGGIKFRRKPIARI